MSKKLPKKSMLGWHIISSDRKLRYVDRRSVKVGESLKVFGKPCLCRWGLHASMRTIDALHCSYVVSRPRYICRVKLSASSYNIKHGTVIKPKTSPNKSVANVRKCLYVWDMRNNPIFRKFVKELLLDAKKNKVKYDNIIKDSKEAMRSLKRISDRKYHSANSLLDAIHHYATVCSNSYDYWHTRQSVYRANKMLEDLLLEDMKKQNEKETKKKSAPKRKAKKPNS
jgi:hypothetical protein